MAIPGVEYYKTGIHNFPSDEIAFKNKNEAWHKAYAVAILADYANGRTGIAYAERDRLIKNRLYADGNNSQSPFKDLVLDFDKDEQEKKAYANIDFEIIPIIAKFKSVFIGILSTTKHRAAADSIDPGAMNKKLINKSKLWLQKAYQKVLTEIDTKLGVQQIEPPYLPETKAELEMYQQLGGLKLGMEMAIEAGLIDCFSCSRWDEEVVPQILADFFENNLGACRDYLDPHTMKVRTKYVNVVNGIVQYSKSPVFEKSRYFGVIESITVADIRVATGWDEEKLRRIVDKFNGKNGNSMISNWDPLIQSGNAYGPTGASGESIYEYDTMVIPVAVLEFASTMYEYDAERIDQFGNKSFFKTGYDRKWDRSDRKSITTPIKVWHKVSLILGSEEVFDWGLQHDIPRPTFDDARSSFHFYRINGKSLTERAIPHAKQIQLEYLKLQNLSAKDRPPGVAVDWNAFLGIILNGKGVDPMELFKMFNQTGNLFYKNTTIRGHINGGGGVPPVKELRGSYTLQDHLGLIEHHMNQIRELTGVNDLGGRGEETATGAKLSFMTTDIALKQLYNAYLTLVKETAINSAARLRDLLAYSERAREIYAPIIGMTRIELLDLVEDLSTANLSIKIEIEDNDEAIKDLLDKASAAMVPGKNGNPILTFSDYLLIERVAKSGNKKFGYALISQKEAQRDKIDIQRSTEAKKMDEEMAINVATAKTQAELESLKFKTDEEIRAYNAQKDKDEELAQKQHARDMELERLKLSQKEMAVAE